MSRICRKDLTLLHKRCIGSRLLGPTASERETVSDGTVSVGGRSLDQGDHIPRKSHSIDFTALTILLRRRIVVVIPLFLHGFSAPARHHPLPLPSRPRGTASSCIRIYVLHAVRRLTRSVVLGAQFVLRGDAHFRSTGHASLRRITSRARRVGRGSPLGFRDGRQNIRSDHLGCPISHFRVRPFNVIAWAGISVEISFLTAVFG